MSNIKKNLTSTQKAIILIVVALVVMALCVGVPKIVKYARYQVKEVNSAGILYVYPGMDYTSITDSLAPHLKSLKRFLKVADLERLDSNVKPGRYQLDSGERNIELVRALKFGYQDPLLLPIVPFIKTKEQLASRLGSRLCADSAEFMRVFTDSTLLASYGKDTTTLLSLIIPNSYEVYWTISPENFLKKMKRESDAFWNEDRLQKAKKIGLTPTEVYTLASIVKWESNYTPEYPDIASVYLNRLKKGWPLCADPTVIYAVGDFSIGRVLRKHLAVDSPYNTYKRKGLPPGPICIPSAEAIDGVLNPSKGEYMYFCANPKLNGSHLFAKTGNEHMRNARAYQRVLDSLKRAKRMSAEK